MDLAKFLLFTFSSEYRGSVSLAERFDILLHGVQALAHTPLINYPTGFADPAVWILLLVLFPPHTTKLELYWLAKTSDGSTPNCLRWFQKYDFSHRFLALSFIHHRTLTADTFVESLVQKQQQQQQPLVGTLSSQEEVSVKRAFDPDNICIVPRQLNSIRTALRKLNIRYEPRSIKPFIPSLSPENDSDLIEQCLFALQDMRTTCLSTLDVLNQAKRMTLLFHTFLIPNVPVCKAKCVPLSSINSFIDKTLLVRCKSCLNKNSNFARSRKAGFGVNGSNYVCSRCGSDRIESFPLVDIRLLDNGSSFVCNFYVVASSVFRIQKLLRSEKLPIFSPCFSSRCCYEMVDHEKKKPAELCHWEDARYFLRQSCQKCGCGVKKEEEETCVERLLNKTPAIVSHQYEETIRGCRNQRLALAREYQVHKLLCPGCQISLVCNCSSCIRNDQKQYLKQILFTSKNLYLSEPCDNEQERSGKSASDHTKGLRK